MPKTATSSYPDHPKTTRKGFWLKLAVIVFVIFIAIIGLTIALVIPDFSMPDFHYVL